MAQEKLRIDKFLWCIRLFKTRSLSAEACQKGRVKCNGGTVKPSRQVIIGDEYEVKTISRKWIIQVSGLPDHRVDHQTSLNYYIDKTPEELNQKIQPSAFSFYTGKRKSKQGRPTKKAKRQLDELFGRGSGSPID